MNIVQSGDQSQQSTVTNYVDRMYSCEQPWRRSGLAPLAAHGLILETRDRVPHQAPCMEPASPSAVSLPLSLSFMNK